jgi:hypothetical protein
MTVYGSSWVSGAIYRPFPHPFPKVPSQGLKFIRRLQMTSRLARQRQIIAAK